MPTVSLFSYMQEVQRRAGLRVSSSFPTTATDEESNVLYAINNRLRYLNNKYYLIFQQTEYSFTTTAGTSEYDFTQAPYSQTFWRNYRIAKNGLRRSSDDEPLEYLSYVEYDSFRPSSSAGGGMAAYFTAFGSSVLIHPSQTATALKMRYYGSHIGTDAAGTTQKMKLTATDDLPMIEDEWQDVLIIGAAMEARKQFKADDKYAELKKDFEQWENILIDMGNQAGGEEGGPQIVLTPYLYRGETYRRQYYPFFTDHE